MNTIRILSAALFATSIALAMPASAQPAAAASAPAATANTTSPHDCGTTMSKHDHGADKGTPKPASVTMPCGTAAAASVPKKGSRHNHAEINKNS